MQYFCSQCQKKHDVGDISADMFSIGANEILDGIESTISVLMAKNPDSVDALAALQVELKRFLGFFIHAKPEESLVKVTDRRTNLTKELRFNAFFALPGNTIQKEAGAQDTEEGVTNVNYTYRVTLEQLYRYYMLFDQHKDRAALELFTKHNIQQYLSGVVVWTKYLRCEFDEHVKRTLYRVFPDNKFDERGNVRICPHCGRELSYASGMGEEIVVALAGAPRAGKTSCMVALLNTLYSNSLDNFTIQVDGSDKKWRSLLKEISLYRQGLRVEKTPDKATEVPSFSFKLKVGGGAIKVLTIVDMPGEFWVREQGKGIDKEFFDDYAGLYENIDCVWFAISKATIKLYRMESIEMEKYRDKLANGFNENLEQIEIADPHILQQNLHSLATYLRGRGKEMPPFLVMVSKPDFFISSADVTETCSKHRLYPLVGQDPDAYDYPQVKNSVAQANATEREAILSKRPIYLKELDLWNHARNVRRYIQQVNEAFLKAIEENCPKRFYISLSAYGWAAVDPEAYLEQLRRTDATKYIPLAKIMGVLDNFNAAPQAAPAADPFGAPADPFGAPADPFGAPADPFGAPAPAAAPAQPKAPEVVYEPKPPVPYHETYPLLWTLAVNDGLPVCHRVTVNKKFLGKLMEDVSQDKCFRFDGNMELPTTADESAGETARIQLSIARNLLLYGAGKELTFSKTTFEERMKPSELFVHKRDHK